MSISWSFFPNSYVRNLLVEDDNTPFSTPIIATIPITAIAASSYVYTYDIYTYSELRDTEGNSIYLDPIGEYIFDIENKVLHTPSKDYNFAELSTHFNEAINNKSFIGIAFNYNV